MRALGLIVSQGETEHMLSALLRLTFNTIYKLLKNRVLKQELLKFLQMISNFVKRFFNFFGQIFDRSIYRLYIFLILIVSRTPFLGDDLQSNEYTCNCKRFYTGLKG